MAVREVADAAQFPRPSAQKPRNARLAEIVAKLKAAAADARIMAIVKKSNPQNDAEAAPVGKTYYAMYQEGVRPTGQQPFQVFYILISKYAKAEQKPAVFEIALRALRKKFGTDPRARGVLGQMQKELVQLKLKPGMGK